MKLVPSEDAGVCISCGAAIVPFGRLRQRFVLAEFGPLCLKCAGEQIPEQVASARAIEAATRASEKEPD